MEEKTMGSVKQSQIGEQLEFLNIQSENLIDNLKSLTERLSPILNSLGSGEDSAKNPETKLIPLAERINSKAEQIKTANRIIRNIIERIEL